MRTFAMLVIIISALMSEVVAEGVLTTRDIRKLRRHGELRTLAGSICKTARPPARGEIWKSRQSPHIPAFDRRKNSTALIFNRGVSAPGTSCISAYDPSGKLVHKLGVYARGEAEYSARFYGGSGCGDGKTPSTIATTAKRNSGYYAIFLAIGGGQCIRIDDPRRCYNSVGC